MDAETRHQLKTNELGELLERLRDFNNPSVKYPLIVIGVLVVGWIGWSSFAYFQRHGVELNSQKLAEIERQLDPNDPNYAGAVVQLQRLAQESSDAALFAASRIQLARVRYEEAMRMPAERLAKLDEAKSLLLEVRGASRTPVSLDAAAAFALASVYESLSEGGDRAARLAEARKLYDELSTEARFAGSGFASLAKERLSTLDMLSAAIAFTPGISPAPAPVMPSGDSTMPGPKLTVDEGMNVKQLTPEEIEQLLGKINAANPPPGQGAPPPPGGTPAPDQPAPAEPAPQPEQPAPAPPPQPEEPAPQPQTPPADGGE